MPNNTSVNLFIDVVLMVSALIVSGRILYLSLRHEKFLRKHGYKIGSSEYNRVKQLTSIQARVIAAIATPLLVAKTTLDMCIIVHTDGTSGISEIVYVVGFVGVITVVIAIVLSAIFRKI